MINKREELKKILDNRYGFLNKKDLDKLEIMFGEDFNILVETFENGRLNLSIGEFKNLNKRILNDIRDVFLDPIICKELCIRAGIERE